MNQDEGLKLFNQSRLEMSVFEYSYGYYFTRLTLWLIRYFSSSSINPLRPNSDLSQTSPCNIKGLSVSEVMRIENMITQGKFY